MKDGTETIVPILVITKYLIIELLFYAFIELLFCAIVKRIKKSTLTYILDLIRP